MGKWKYVSNTLDLEHRVMGNWYSRRLFTSDDQLHANLHMQE